MLCCPSETEKPALQRLEELALCATADYDRQVARLKTLSADFDRQRVTATPQIFSLLQAEIEQQTLIVQAALQAQADAETALANARIDYDRRRAKECKGERKRALESALAEISTEISQLQASFAQLPEQIAAAQSRHHRLQAELALL